MQYKLFYTYILVCIFKALDVLDVWGHGQQVLAHFWACS